VFIRLFLSGRQDSGENVIEADLAEEVRAEGSAFHGVGHSFSLAVPPMPANQEQRSAGMPIRFAIFETWDGGLDSRDPVVTRVSQQARDLDSRSVLSFAATGRV